MNFSQKIINFVLFINFVVFHKKWEKKGKYGTKKEMYTSGSNFFLSAKNRQDYVQKQPEKRFYLHTF